MIRSILFAIFVLIFACGLACAEPVIKFDNLSIDLGDVYECVKVTSEFKFTNTGDKTLEINKVSVSCPSCSQAKADSVKVEPGKSSKILFTFVPSSGNYVFTKNVFVETNDPANQKLTLSIKGKTLALARLSAQSINFGTLPPKTTKDFLITLIPINNNNFGICKITTDGTHLKTSYKKVRDSYHITATLNTGETIGRIYEKIEIVLSVKGNPVYTTYIYGNIQQPEPLN
jgi:hypothetical protein